MLAPRRLSVETHPRAPLPLLLVGLFLLGVTGCASERENLLERSAAHVAYRLPAEQILQATREVLEEQGYRLLPSTDPYYVRTSWREKFDDSLDMGALRERQFVMLKPLDDGRFMVNAYRLTFTTIGRTEAHPITPKTDDPSGVQKMIKGDPVSYARPTVVRDLKMEWQILSRLSPSTAQELETQVDDYLAPPSK